MNKSISVFTILMILVIVSSCKNYSSSEMASLDKGKEIYLTHCVSCHGPDGEGMGAYPSLLKAEIQVFHTKRAISLITKGSSFEDGMKPIPLSDEEIANVVNYIQHSWNNEADFLSSSEIMDLKTN